MNSHRSLRESASVIFVILLGALACDTPNASDLEAVVVRSSVCGDNPFHPVGAWEASNVEVSPEDDTIRSCQSTAADCTAFFACAGIDDSMSCELTDFARHCEGGVLVSCSTPYVRRKDCRLDPDGNHRCLVDTEGRARCAVGLCDEESRFCDGELATLCRAGLLSLEADCAVAGRQCALGVGSFRCLDRLEACERDVCEGDVLRQCFANLGTRDFDCASSGAHCGETSGGVECIPDAPECEDGDVACEGAVARACSVGRWWEVDCSRFAGATCEVRPVGEADYPSCRVQSDG